MNASRSILLVARPWARAAAIAAAVIGAAGSAFAQTVTWTGANNSWTQPDSDSFDAEYVSGATAVFAGAGSGSTITLGGGLTPGQVNVTDGNYTFSGGGIGGTGGLAKSGTGQLTLSASNSFTGNTTVDGGTLLLSNSNALQGSTFAGGAGTLAFAQVSASIFTNYYYLGGLSGSSSLSLLDTSNNAIRLNFGLNNADTTFSGNLTNGQFIEKLGTGTTTLSGNISTGAAGGAMGVDQGGLRQTGGTITLNRDNGSSVFTVGLSSGTTGNYILESGTVLTTSKASGHMRLGISGGTGILTINGSSARAYFAGTNNTIGGNDIVASSGTGTINLMAGELAVNSLTTGTVAGSTGSFNFSGGTLRPYDQDTTIGRVTGFTIALAGTSATVSGIDAAGTARTLTILTTLGDGTAGAGDLNVSGGTVVLLRTNTFTGNTTVSSGTLLLNNPNALRNSTFAGGAGTLAFGNTSSETYTFGGLSGSSALSLKSTNNSPVILAFGSNNSSTTYSGNVTDVAGVNQGVNKIGTGTTTISGNWTLGVNGVASDGGMNVFDGEIRQDGGTVTLRRNQFSGPFLVGGVSGSTGRYTITSGTVLATNSATPGGSNFRIGSNGGTGILTIDGGSARAFFSGINNNLGGNDHNNTSGTGTINLSAGELAVNSLTTGTVAGSTGSFNFSGGTLRPYSQNTSIGGSGAGFTIALAGTSATFSGLDAAAGTARTLTILTTLVDGTAGAAGAIFSGGTVSLTAASTYTGSTSVSGGTLSLAAGGSFANSTSISVASGATLGLTSKTSGFSFGSTQTLGGSGSVALPTSGTGVSLAGFLAPGGGSAGTLAFTNAGTFDITSAINSPTNRLQFGLGTVSDLVTVAGGTLAIGTGLLEFNDFDFTELTGFDQGTYTLFSAQSLSGTLGASTSGSIGSFTGTLSQVGNTVQLVVVPEPGTLPLAGLGFAAAAWSFRRRAAVR